MDGLTFTEPTRSRPELPLWKLIKYARDLWPLRNREDDASRTQQQESNLRQSWGQAFVALVVFAVCIQLFWSVHSRVHSPVQSIVQVLQRPVCTCQITCWLIICNLCHITYNLILSSSFDLASLIGLSSLIAEGDQKLDGDKASYRSRNEASID